ncbi:hypothetical protein WN48_05821 [Eufriesea mexicana]|uniref:PH domain-containing protein n=1 Tax=Eufriesea mexicana TaxID=516756 RepID=A0A310SK45_9HYME|nr:hypothetical protein WN48_05821 [Eufriesea mexicana]
MAEEEICGFLDVKFCGSKSKVHKVKKRTLGTWKVWKRHWCSFQKLGSELGVRVHLDYCIGNDSISSSNDKENFIIIPLDTNICRTQSRSKQFAFGIFPIKERKPLIYLAGLYGDLITNTLGVIIKDIHSGDIIEIFEWKELHQFHLVTAGRPEDVKCICVIHTTKKFRAGIGELHLFCSEATKLLQDLVTQGHGPRHKQTNGRPLSLSEGDIRAISRDELSRSYSIINERMELKMLSKRRESNEKYEEISCKMPNKMTEDVYQPEPYSHHVRRYSNISTTSGIYEEIPDETNRNTAAVSSFYMEHLFCNLQSEEPPPLPPRQRCASESMKGSSSLPLTSHRNSVQIERNNLEFQRIMDESNYVPMLPQLKDITLLEMQAALQENDYVIMR